MIMDDPGGYDIPDPSKLGAPAPASAGADPGGGEGGGAGRLPASAHDALMAIPGVVMVGEGQDEIGNPALIVGVKTAGDLKNVPASHGGLPVRAEVIGEVDALFTGGQPR
jgi:hypothetical protein